MAALSLTGVCANTIPRSSRNALNWLMTAVRRGSTGRALNGSPGGPLVVGLDRNKTHVLGLDSLSDRFRIHEVVLVRLHERLHKLRTDQSHMVALLPQCSSEEMRS
jgi:hypothetical protein